MYIYIIYTTILKNTIDVYIYIYVYTYVNVYLVGQNGIYIYIYINLSFNTPLGELLTKTTAIPVTWKEVRSRAFW